MTMTSSNKLIPAALIALTLGGLGMASAQNAAPATSASVVAPSSPADVTPQQMRIQAQTFLPQMDQSAQTVRRQLEQSRESRDVVKVLCLNDKLNQIDVAIRAARDRMPALNAALDKNDTDNSRHEFAVLQVLRDRVRTLVQESNQCIGEEAGFVGESKVIVNIDPGIPTNDQTVLPSQTDTVIVLPPPASPNL
jgi:hypothetical protein